MSFEGAEGVFNDGLALGVDIWVLVEVVAVGLDGGGVLKAVDGAGSLLGYSGGG